MQNLSNGPSALVSKNDNATRRKQRERRHQPKMLQSPFLLFSMLVLATMCIPESAAFQPPLRVPSQLQVTNIMLWQKYSRPTIHASSAQRRITKSYSKVFMATSDVDDLNSNDPFVILGLDPKVDGMDKKTIKRAYKRRALRYHPDVVCNPNSTDKERRMASDQFAKINAAYETLSGKGSGSGNGSAASSRSSSSSTGGGWTPPHRRSPGEAGRSYSAENSNGGGTSWEDFMPKYDDADYDAAGDSFGSIFADLVAGAAGAAAGYSSSSSGSIMTDFVEFLEQNLDGYSSGSDGSGSNRSSDKAKFDLLLRTGSVDEIGEEMDDTELVVQQLNSKCQNLENERMSLEADLANAQRFSETVDFETRLDECNARRKVVDKYLTQARKRLLALQTRYKELIMGGRNDSKAGGRSSSRRSSSGPSSSSSSSSNTGTTGGATSRDSTRTASSNPDDAWKSDSFGSNGRSRGSGRRRSSRSRAGGAGERVESSTASSASSSSYSSPSSSSTSAYGGASRRSTASTQSTVPVTTSPSPSPSSGDSSYVPPHRRTRAPTEARDDTQRLRDLKVDDEFEKLKKEMGL